MGERRYGISKIVVGLIFAVFLSGLGISQFYHIYKSLMNDLCGVVFRKYIPSTDIEATLVAFEVSCGATTPELSPNLGDGRGQAAAV